MSAHAHVVLSAFTSGVIATLVMIVTIRDLREQRFWKWWTSNGGMMWLLAWMIIYLLLA